MEEEFKFPAPPVPVPPEYERVPSEVLRVALSYKLLKAMRETVARLEELKKAMSPLQTQARRMRKVELPETIIDVEGMGCLKAFLAKSSRSDFKMRLYADGMELYNNDYSWFESVSQEISELSAFLSVDNDYVLSIADVKFINSLKLILEPTGASFELDELYYKLDVTP